MAITDFFRKNARKLVITTAVVGAAGITLSRCAADEDTNGADPNFTACLKEQTKSTSQDGGLFAGKAIKVSVAEQTEGAKKCAELAKSLQEGRKPR